MSSETQFDDPISRPDYVTGVVTDRSWRSYFDMFQIPQETNWSGKQVLDVGSGKKPKKSEEFLPGATVVALDPSFYTGSEKKWGQIFNLIRDNLLIHPTENAVHNKVKAVAEALPFPSDSFDTVFASFSVPMNASDNNKAQVVSEMFRVLKPGGTLYVTPINLEAPVYGGVVLLFDELRSQGHHIEYIGNNQKAWKITKANQ